MGDSDKRLAETRGCEQGSSLFSAFQLFVSRALQASEAESESQLSYFGRQQIRKRTQSFRFLLSEGWLRSERRCHSSIK
jgi:hypothetical protein